MCTRDRHPIQCILPPHMTEALKRSGDPNLRQAAEQLERDVERARTEKQTVTAHGAKESALGILAALSLPPETEKGKISRTIHTAGNTFDLPGDLVRGEQGYAEGVEPDDAVDEAFEGLGDTHQLYLEAFKRDSLDDDGMPLIASVHYRRSYNNALWNGSQMIFGDGGLFNRMTASLAVIGHELTHGVVQFSGGLYYSHQSGALNDSVADVFGVLTEQFKKGQNVHESSWLVGAELFDDTGLEGHALRSMKAPGTAYDDSRLGKDPQPFHMNGYVNTDFDNGGVHINSGIPNHAFFLLASYLGGRAWEKAGQIWYDTLQKSNDIHTTFSEWADLTVVQARERYGVGSLEAQYTARSWKLVGLL